MAASIREQIADQIKDDNPSFNVKAYPADSPENLGRDKAQVSVYREALTANGTSMEHKLAIEIITGYRESKEASDHLDGTLDLVLTSIERLPGILWTSADYVIFDEKFQGYKVTVTASSPNYYKNIVRSEQEGVTS